jgi:GntR family transcriptional regulator
MLNSESKSRLQNIITRASKLPLHHQLYDLLRGKIRSGEWIEGQMIPTEPEMIIQYGVSRIVIRQVLNRLVNEGLIFRQQGRGSFVAERRLEEGLSRIISFTEDMRQRGLTPKTRVLFKGLVPAAEDIAEHLGIQAGDELARLERLRLANDEPMSIEESYLVHSYFPGVLNEDFALVPLRQSLHQNFGVRITRARQVIRAVQATSEEARLLTTRRKSPLLLIERISFSEQNLPVEFLRIYYRGDRYSLYNDLHE